MHEVMAYKLVMPKGAPARASSFYYDQLLGVGNSNLDCNQPRISSVTRVTNTVPHSNQPLPSCNEECRTQTSSFPQRDSTGICPITGLQPTGCPHVGKTLVNFQALDNGANMAGPSPSQVQLALVPPRFDEEDGNDTRLFPRLTGMDIDPPIAPPRTSDSPIIEGTTVNSQVPVVATNSTGPSSSQDMNRGSPNMNVRSIYANDEEIRNLKRKVEELDDKEAVIKKQMEIDSTASSVRKKPRILVERWLKETERARNKFKIIGQTDAETLPPKEQVETLTREVEELIEQTLPQTLPIEDRDAKEVEFLERKLTGEVIHENIELIWDCLKENHACKLGIYGMGGVGKTTIMMHIHNRLLKDATFGGVVFISVPRLQHL
ncbi:hypothetical protein BT93_L5632 [Corymbia citriodora subsp. variegata]|uniref:NB-ARC domain-containing protein n=1 Tax=Corymbia citriodora subsp. variegata TaxID=360336 RepID=A0A8T0CVX7_CORYI|nr:hypothetical protein BT93_L5632 [Corymbia citriodora subsp. variegata]